MNSLAVQWPPARPLSLSVPSVRHAAASDLSPSVGLFSVLYCCCCKNITIIKTIKKEENEGKKEGKSEGEKEGGGKFSPDHFPLHLRPSTFIGGSEGTSFVGCLRRRTFSHPFVSGDRGGHYATEPRSVCFNLPPSWSAQFLTQLHAA